MNFPKLTLKMPFVSEQDRADLIFGCHEQVDFVAASYVSCRENVEEVRALLRANGGGDIDIIAKIENFDGVSNIKSILQVSDGIMVARGDLGVEIPFVELPRIQKSLIQSARQLGRRVIVATEMLESMIQKPRPTRAEVSDVANAVIDGASAIMLSGETAAGKFPVDCMKVMSDIATEAEKSLDYHERLKSLETVVKDLSDATCHAAAVAAHDLNAKMIIVFTRTGQSARMVSRFRPEIPVIAATHDKRGYTKVTLSWGVYPVFVSEAKSSHDLFKVAERCALENGCRPGDRIIITVGYPLSGPTNTMRIIEIEAA
jgi:pyruvate kinase